jgi:LruC domain-containing protein
MDYLPEVEPIIVDIDGDGVIDANDDYPNDPNKAFDHFYPSRTSTSTLSFEDQWPVKGDYDFNDMVVDYRFNQVTNAGNQIVQIDVHLEIKAIGAGYRNGFGFTLPISPSIVGSVTGMNLQHNIVTLSANGTEAGQEYATVIAFDNAFNLFDNNQVRYINTDVSKPTEPSENVNINLILSNPIPLVGFGSPPFNPFIIVNLARGKEVHLPNFLPTSLADQSLFGTGDDDTDPSKGKYYKTKNNLPWVMQTPSPFDYLVEKKPIINGHLVFSTWAQSGGTLYSDWYLNRPGYRNQSNIFGSSQ